MRVFLIGFMGSGKTTYGRELAERAGRVFIDLDEVIETEAGKSITEIFAGGGEERFRVLEHEALRRTIAIHPEAVIAVGGGTPCYFNNMELMNGSGITIYLQHPPEVLAAYLEEEPDKRPLISGMGRKELREYIAGKLQEREPFYRQAQVILKWPDISAAALMRFIVHSS